MESVVRSAIAVALCWLALSGSAVAEKRVALVVGNSNYQSIPRLANPGNDARLLAGTLRELGFVLVGGGPQLDLDKASFDKAVQAFGKELVGADVGLFFFAGHGMQVRGTNYLFPVNGNPMRDADVDFQLLDANLVLKQMEGATTRLNIVILDACRNNPFSGPGLRSANRGLTQMTAPEGTLISFATQPGNVAMDGDGNSPYSRALAQAVRRPGVGLFDVFNEVGLDVKRATGGSQQPWLSSSPITGQFYFAGPPPAQPSPVPLPAARDELAWSLMKETNDLSVLRRFVFEFPASAHRREADEKIASLENLSPATKSPATGSAIDTAISPAVSQKEEAAWQVARNSSVLFVLEEFLKAYPTSRHADEAKERLKQLQAELTPPTPRFNMPDRIGGASAAATSRPPAPSPGGKQPPATGGAVSSTVSPPASKEEAAWQVARSSSVLFVVEEFVKAYPASRHADEARERIKQLQAELAPPSPRFDLPDRIGNRTPARPR